MFNYSDVIAESLEFLIALGSIIVVLGVAVGLLG